MNHAALNLPARFIRWLLFVTGTVWQLVPASTIEAALLNLAHIAKRRRQRGYELMRHAAETRFQIVSGFVLQVRPFSPQQEVFAAAPLRLLLDEGEIRSIREVTLYCRPDWMYQMTCSTSRSAALRAAGYARCRSCIAGCLSRQYWDRISW